jgi:hypothetical protein
MRLRGFVRRIAVLAGAAGAMAIIVFLASPAINQSFEAVNILLRFIVIDADSGLPVPDAMVKLREFNRANYPAPTTGPDGQTTITVQFKCCSSSTFFRKSRRVIDAFWEVDVEAAGYDTLNTALTEFTGENRFHDDAATPPLITLRLHHKAESRRR